MQVAIAAAKHAAIPTIPTLVAVLAQAGDDPLVPRIVWQNLHPLLETHTAEFVAEIQKPGISGGPDGYPKPVLDLLPRAADRILSTPKPDTLAVAEMVKLLLASEATDDAADRCLQLLTARIRSGEITGDSLTSIQQQLTASLTAAMKQNLARPSTLSAVELATSLKMSDAINKSNQFCSQSDNDEIRLRLVNALVTAGHDNALIFAESILTGSVSSDVRRKAVQTIGRIGTKNATAVLVRNLATLPADVQPAVVESMSDREDSTIELLELIRDKKVSPSVINANQAQKMLSMKSP